LKFLAWDPSKGDYLNSDLDYAESYKKMKLARKIKGIVYSVIGILLLLTALVFALGHISQM